MAKKQEKKSRSKEITPYEGFKRVDKLFLDSGAHSLHNQNQLDKFPELDSGELTEEQKAKFAKMSGAQITALKRSSPYMFRSFAEQHKFANSPEFWKYVDDYANYVKANLAYIDYYVNVDVIFNPKKSWEVLKYLENQHGLQPLPVIHSGTPLKWLERHLEADYEYIGIGGLGQGTNRREAYQRWADGMFNVICSTPDRLPCVRTHGFAMTTHETLFRYPWWSVDSSTWAKNAGFGMVLVPRKRNGIFDFTEIPYLVTCSVESPMIQSGGRKHLFSLPEGNLARQATLEWLESIEIPIGTVDKEKKMVEWGVISHHSARKIANLKFFLQLQNTIPEYPWPFHKPPRIKKFAL